jgi:hypothetical protein
MVTLEAVEDLLADRAKELGVDLRLGHEVKRACHLMSVNSRIVADSSLKSSTAEFSLCNTRWFSLTYTFKQSGGDADSENNDGPMIVEHRDWQMNQAQVHAKEPPF